MPLFNYTALTMSGSELKGKQHAEDVTAAMQALRQQNLRVIEIKPARGGQGFLGQANFSDWLASQRSVSNSSLIFFFRQMAFMLKAGLPVLEALELASTQVSSPRLRLTLRLMKQDIESGQALSLAMKKHPQVFPDMAINLIIAGENTGELDLIMERLAVHLEKKAAVRSHMINAMIYPTVVIVAAIGVSIFMVVKIIPKFASFLQGQGRALPPSTQALIDISDFLRNQGFYILGGFIAIIVMVLLMYQTQRGRLIIDDLTLRIPVVGPMLVTGSMAQITWALSTLLSSGVTVFNALIVTSDLLNNRVYVLKLKQAADLIMTGKDLASSIAHKHIPELITQMMVVGERTGSLDKILQELGTYYEQLLATAIKRLAAMIEPAMILFIGAIVGFVYYAFFQALFSLVSGG